MHHLSGAAARRAAGAEHLDGHRPGAINVPVSGSSFATKAGFVLDAAQSRVRARRRPSMRRARDPRPPVGGVLRHRRLRARRRRRAHRGGHASTSSRSSSPTAPTVIDVRETDERETGYIPGSRNIPYRLVGSPDADLPTERPVVTICESGARAAIAASVLRARGYDARPVVDGGPRRVARPRRRAPCVRPLVQEGRSQLACRRSASARAPRLAAPTPTEKARTRSTCASASARRPCRRSSAAARNRALPPRAGARAPAARMSAARACSPAAIASRGLEPAGRGSNRAVARPARLPGRAHPLRAQALRSTRPGRLEWDVCRHLRHELVASGRRPRRGGRRSLPRQAANASPGKECLRVPHLP